MTQQIINIGSAANDGTGDTLRAAGGKLNANDLELYQLTARHQPTRLLIEGDSKANLIGGLNARSALFWATAMNPVDIVYNGSVDNLAVGSSNSSGTDQTLGMTSTTRLGKMTTRINAVRAAGQQVAVLMKIGTNDVGAVGDNVAGSIIANIRKAWASYKAAGATTLILMSIDPAGGSTPTADRARASAATNRAMRELARQFRHEIHYVDTSTLLASPTSELYAATGTVGTAGSTMYDELHESARGAYLQGLVLTKTLARLFPPRSGLLTTLGDIYGTPLSARGNIFGRHGRFFDTGGVADQNQVTGGGGLTGIANFPSAKLFTSYPNIAGGLTGSLAIAVSQVAWAPAAAQGRSDIKATRLTFSGTTGNACTVQVGSTVFKPSGIDLSIPYDFEADLFANALVGAAAIAIDNQAFGVGSAAAGSGQPADLLPQLDGRLTPALLAPRVDDFGGTISISINCTFAANTTVSGSIDVYGLGMFQNPALPAA